MTPTFLFCLSSLFLYKMAVTTDQSPSVHPERFTLADVGENISLKCFYDMNVASTIYWYKQTLGRKPEVIMAFIANSEKAPISDEYEANVRFTLDVGHNKMNLNISDLQVSDSATYLCAKQKWTALNFDEGITVSVRASESNIQVLVHQSEDVQPRGSVSLSCAVQTSSCDEEYRVYWFKNIEEPHSGLFYIHDDSSDQCEKKQNTQTQTCVYSLSLENFNLSHSGTYYCAVALCGHVVFGNGIELDHKVLVYFWSAASAVSSLLSVSLAFSICVMNKRTNSTSSDSPAALSPSSKIKLTSHLYENTLYCIALVEMKRSEREMDRTWTECVYSSVTQ